MINEPNIPVKLVSFENKLRTLSEAYFQIHYSNWQFVVTNYYNAQQKTGFTLNLFSKLLTAFYKSAEAYGLTNGGQRVISGIYVIFNKVNYTTYIGESQHIYRRLNEHCTELLLGIHVNKALQNDVKQYNKKLDSLVFLIYDFGYSLNNRDSRLAEEKRLIETWPGKVYNVVHNNRKL